MRNLVLCLSDVRANANFVLDEMDAAMIITVPDDSSWQHNGTVYARKPPDNSHIDIRRVKGESTFSVSLLLQPVTDARIVVASRTRITFLNSITVIVIVSLFTASRSPSFLHAIHRQQLNVDSMTDAIGRSERTHKQIVEKSFPQSNRSIDFEFRKQKRKKTHKKRFENRNPDRQDRNFWFRWKVVASVFIDSMIRRWKTVSEPALEWRGVDSALFRSRRNENRIRRSFRPFIQWSRNGPDERSNRKIVIIMR